jgi:hypothetical protein
LVVLLACLFSLAVALSPVSGYDGSEALAERLELPGLHRRALADWWGRLRRVPPVDAEPRERRVFRWYGPAWLLYNLLMAAWVVLLWIGLFA